MPDRLRLLYACSEAFDGLNQHAISRVRFSTVFSTVSSETFPAWNSVFSSVF
jgi:hypothetical protein